MHLPFSQVHHSNCHLHSKAYFEENIHILQSIDWVRFSRYSAYVNVYLPKEDIANFEPKQKITVVGSMDGKVDETKNPYNGNMDYYYTLEPAYFVTDRYEYTGELNSENSSFDGAWNIRMEGSSLLPLIYFAEGIDGSEYIDKEITFTAKRIGGDPAFYDAEILK